MCLPLPRNSIQCKFCGACHRLNFIQKNSLSDLITFEVDKFLLNQPNNRVEEAIRALRLALASSETNEEANFASDLQALAKAAAAPENISDF